MNATVIIDEFGRLVLPKHIREAIGIKGRMSLTLEVVDNAARISTPKPRTGDVTRKRDRVVYFGKLPANWNSGKALMQMRERRIRR